MNNYGWVLATLLVVGMVSCAGRSVVGVDFSPVPAAQTETGQPVGQVSVSSINGQGEFRVEEETANGKQLVSIIADAPVSASAVLLEITYDAGTYNPLVVHLGDKLLALPDALTLELMKIAGAIQLGVVPISGQPIELSEGETIVQIMFEPAGGLPKTLQKNTSAVPSNANAVVPLIWDEAEGELRWYMVNPGDYDQNGEVGVSDLVPLAIHFGETGPFEYGQIQSVIDGNRDGEINLQDITPIAQGFGNTVQGYKLYASSNIADIPRGYTEPSVVEPVATFMLAEATNASARADERLYFNYTPSAEQQDLMFWARPFELDSTDMLSEGTRSNINGPAISQNPDPDGPDFNFAPVASLSLDFLGSSVPLEVLLDGSGSNDPDGYIAFYEWDFEGDGLVDAYSTDAVIAHTYNNPGTFSPTLIVTDNQGGRDTFASPPFTATRDEVSNIVPFADLYATEYSGSPPLTVGLIATGSSDVDGYIAKYEWDFDGDGTVDLDSGMDPTVMHTYDEDGVYACRVTVTDDAGASAFAEVEIEVVAHDENWPPLPDIFADPTFGEEGVRVTLDASGSSDVDGEIVLYEWDFDGDGSYDSYGTKSTVTHIYNNYGVYAAAVRITDDGGQYNIANTSIYVNEPMDLSIPWSSFGRDRRNTHQSPYVGAQTDNLKWSIPLDGYQETSLAVGSDGTVYARRFSHQSDGQLYAINPDGTEKWLFTGVSRDSSLAIGSDGTVYVGGSYGELFAINPNGTEKWSLPTGGYVSGLAIGIGGTLFVTSSRGLSAFNPDGTEKWLYTTDYGLKNDPAINAGGTLYVASELSNDRLLQAINPDGSFKWSSPIGNFSYNSPAIGADGTVYFKDSAFNLDGTHQRSFPLGSTSSSAAVGSNGTIYLTGGITIGAFDPDGSERWSFSADTTANGSLSSPAIGADGVIYFGCDRYFYALNPDGTEKWSYAVDVLISPPAIGMDGTVYVGGDGRLYAFGVGNSPIAAISANPTFGHIPLDVDFDASGSIDPDGTVVNYEWDFDGDGEYDLSGPSSTVSHTYTEGGIFAAKVRVTDDEGAQGTAKVEVMILGPGVWGYQTIDSAGDAGMYSSLAVVNGNPAICYYKESNWGILKFVRALDSKGITWGTPVTIDTADYAGLGTSMAIVDGNPAISYFDNTNGELKFVSATDADGNTWGAPQIIDSPGNGWFTSLCVVDGNPAISYNDSNTNELKYIRATNATGSTWGVPQSLDSALMATDISLCVVNGNPSVSYNDYFNPKLKFVRAANVSGSSWDSPQVVDSDGVVGQYASLAVVDGNPAISYYGNSVLKYIRATNADGSSWGTPQRPDISGVVGYYTSLAVVGGYPAISYYDNTNGDLKYVQAANAGGSLWEAPLAVDTVGYVGEYTSLAVVNGSPAISYKDETNDDLKFARLY